MSWSDYGVENKVVNDNLATLHSPNFHHILTELFNISRRADWPLIARTAKAAEEVGELNTAALIIEGHITHKSLPEPIEGEVADVIICAFDTLCEAYRDQGSDKLIDMLHRQLVLKSTKWNKAVTDKEMQNTCQAPGNSYD